MWRRPRASSTLHTPALEQILRFALFNYKIIVLLVYLYECAADVAWRELLQFSSHGAQRTHGGFSFRSQLRILHLSVFWQRMSWSGWLTSFELSVLSARGKNEPSFTTSFQISSCLSSQPRFLVRKRVTIACHPQGDIFAEDRTQKSWLWVFVKARFISRWQSAFTSNHNELLVRTWLKT